MREARGRDGDSKEYDRGHPTFSTVRSGSRIPAIASRGIGGRTANILARESASLQSQRTGFSAAATGVEIPSVLREWQVSADPRLWKLIISPEFGERLDLQRLTRDVMGRMETDLYKSLEWVAVVHFNTEHPHVHVALRGVDANGEAFQLDRDYVRNGLRSVAQHFATVQLGYRTEQDAALAFRRQVPLQRFTPLDRLIVARTQPLDGISGDFRVTASWPRAICGNPRAIAGVPLDDSPNDGARPTARTRSVASSARFRDRFEGYEASSG